MTEAEDLARYRRTITILARKYRRRGEAVGLSVDDLKQEAAIGMLRALRNADRSNEGQLSRYLWVRAEGAILDALRSYPGRYRVNGGDMNAVKFVPLDDESYDGELPFSMDPAAFVELQDTLENAMAALGSEDAKTAFRYLLDTGRGYVEAVHDIGFKATTSRYSQIARRLKDALGGTTDD